MAQFITLDDKDVVVSTQESMYIPGFEKREDGNYYKKNGDPRCITDKHIAWSIKMAAEKDKKKEERDSQNIQSNDPKTSPLGLIDKAREAKNIAQEGRFRRTRNYFVENPIDIDRFSMTCSKNSVLDSSGEKILYNVMMRGDCGIPYIPWHGCYSRVVFIKKPGVLKLYGKDPMGEPDVVIVQRSKSTTAS